MPRVRDWYEWRKGNIHGVPVLHVSVNLLPQDFLHPYVEAFISEHELRAVANDYNAKGSLGPTQTNAVHDTFAQQFMKPVILVINCVSNSPSAPFGTLLLSQTGGPADWTVAQTQWHAAINSVTAPAPQLTNLRRSGGGIQFTFPGQDGRTNRIESTTDFLTWTTVTNVSGTNGPVTFHDPNAALHGRRFYRVRRL